MITLDHVERDFVVGDEVVHALDQVTLDPDGPMTDA